MNSKFLSQLSSEEYAELTKELHVIQNATCYICGKSIDLDLQKTNIDHIIPLANKGKDDKNNFALTHESCNKSKQDANLTIARSLHKLKSIQDDVQKQENRLASLKDLLSIEGGAKYVFKYKVDGDIIKYSFDDLGDINIYEAKIFIDSLSKEKSCFINVPIEYIYHDEVINPRGINSSINLLVKEFYKGNPQLHLTLARIDDNHIKVFDGQHKAAAQILLGCRTILVRLFIDSDINRLTETNANAGSKLRQIAFDKSVMRQLNNTLYLERVKKYQNDHSLNEDDYSFSETQLCDYFRGENIKKYIIDALKSSITNSQDNKLKDFIDFEGKGKILPISHSTFDKTMLSRFIDAKRIMNTPLNFKTEDGRNPRELEIIQISKLMSIIAETFYIGSFNPETGVHRIEQRIIDKRDSDISDNHLAAYRISKEEIVYAWMPYLINVIKTYFLTTATKYEEGSLFQTEFPEQLWKNIRRFLQSLLALPLWKDRSMASSHFSGKKTADFWRTIFETAKTPDGVLVLLSPLNHIEMIKDSSND